MVYDAEQRINWPFCVHDASDEESEALGKDEMNRILRFVPRSAWMRCSPGETTSWARILQ